MYAHDGRAGPVAGGDFFQGHGVGQVAGVATAPLFRHQHAEKAQFGHFADGLLGKAVLAVPLGRERFQAFLGELSGRVADLQLFVIGQHVQSLIQAFDCHGRGFTAADADGGDATLEAFLAQGRQQRHQNPRA